MAKSRRIGGEEKAKATVNDGKITPMMEQYLEVRKGLPEKTLLLFRLGDFYEFFFQDAELAAKILGLTLTRRQTVPMAGIPYHAAGGYLQKLLEAGYKAAICDQLEAATPGKIVSRALTRIYTPGTALEADQIEAKTNHYMLAFEVNQSGISAAWMELSTGEIFLAQHENPGDLLALLSSFDPREILVPERATETWKDFDDPWLNAFQMMSTRRLTSEIPAFYFDPTNGLQILKETLGVLTLAGFDVDENHPALGPAGALLYYANQNLCSRPKNIHSVRVFRFEKSLLVDETSLRHLEVMKSSAGEREGSLLGAMDLTQTPAGARLMQQFLSAPLLSVEEIFRRQDCVETCHDAYEKNVVLRIHLEQTRDLMRILGRLQNRIKNPREVLAIRQTLLQLPKIRRIMKAMGGSEWLALSNRLGSFEELERFLHGALAEELPNNTREPGFIRAGFHNQLDHYRQLLASGHNWLRELEQREQEATGIKNLRIKYNGSFGYFIEVTKSYQQYVPSHYVRRQTTVNGERYVTPELRQKEQEIFEAQENALLLEQKLFDQVLKEVEKYAEGLRKTAVALAEVDVFSSWGLLAHRWNYCRPLLNEGDGLHIVKGRHPVVEQALAKSNIGLGGSSAFVANDVNLSCSEHQIGLITGPNMAGKSTYIRQTALIVLMAQAGSWVPAESATIGLVDRIFSRVGASDNLARGQSTFMVEMSETAHILNHMTDRSFLILDEIGRGTSTYDGLSIAWSVAEHIHGEGKVGPRTLFATHYHEMTALERTLPRLKNFHIAVHESEDEILFLRQVRPGPADRSYGIQVAKLAGLPRCIIQRAKKILDLLEREGRSFNVNLDQLK